MTLLTWLWPTFWLFWGEGNISGWEFFYEQCRPSAFVDASYCSLVSLTLQSQIHCEVGGAHISPINTQTNKQTNKHCQEKNIQFWRRNMSQVFCYFWEGDRCLVSCCPQALLNLDPVCCEGSLLPLECNQPKYWFVAVCCLGGKLCSHIKILNLITGLLPLVVWGIGALPLSQSGNLLEKDCILHSAQAGKYATKKDWNMKYGAYYLFLDWTVFYIYPCTKVL